MAYSCDAPRHATPRAARRDRSRRRGEDKPRCDDDYERHRTRRAVRALAPDAGRGRTDSEGAGREQRRAVRAMAPDAESDGTDTNAAGLRPRDHHTSAAAVELRSRRGRTSQKSDAPEELARR